MDLMEPDLLQMASVPGGPVIGSGPPMVGGFVPANRIPLSNAAAINEMFVKNKFLEGQ
jgi:hypothetical protein